MVSASEPAVLALKVLQYIQVRLKEERGGGGGGGEGRKGGGTSEARDIQGGEIQGGETE